MKKDIVTDKSFKYEVRKLDNTSEEFTFIENFVHATAPKTPTKRIQHHAKLRVHQIYKIDENSEIEAARDAESGNLMLFHGTDKDGVYGVLKEGFENSPSGWFGEGVYMTDSSNMAYSYGWDKSLYQHKSYVYFFVNEVYGSEGLQTIEHDYFYGLGRVATEIVHPFCKHIVRYTPQPDDESDYRVDGQGRKYRNALHVRKNLLKNSAFDEYVADESVVVPRYLVAIDVYKK